MRPIAAVLLCLVAVPHSAAAAEWRGRCLLKVDGKTYINGPCDVDAADSGRLTISTVSGKEYFATVFAPDADGLADGNWTGTGTGGLAERFDNRLRLKGDCWQNATAQVCAYP